MSCFMPRCFECGMFIAIDFVFYKQWFELYQGDIKKVMIKLQERRRSQKKAPLYDCCQTRLRTFVDTEKYKIRFSAIQQKTYPSVPYYITPEDPLYNETHEKRLEIIQQTMNG